MQAHVQGSALCARRYLYQHTYNITLVEMVDKISNPPVKAFMTEWMNKKLDSFPTPADYAKALSICKQPFIKDPC